MGMSLYKWDRAYDELVQSSTQRRVTVLMPQMWLCCTHGAPAHGFLPAAPVPPGSVSGRPEPPPRPPGTAGWEARETHRAFAELCAW